MNIAVIGSRSVTDYEYVKSILMSYVDLKADTIVSGGARGADSLGERFAREFCENEPLIFLADWDRFGKSAGYRRNHDIIDNSDEVISFHDGESRGTLHSMKLAEDSDKVVHLFPSERPEQLDVFNL